MKIRSDDVKPGYIRLSLCHCIVRAEVAVNEASTVDNLVINLFPSTIPDFRHAGSSDVHYHSGVRLILVIDV